MAIGGGGLIAGIAAYVKALHPGVKIIGVEPAGALHVRSIQGSHTISVKPAAAPQPLQTQSTGVQPAGASRAA